MSFPANPWKVTFKIFDCIPFLCDLHVTFQPFHSLVFDRLSQFPENMELYVSFFTVFIVWFFSRVVTPVSAQNDWTVPNSSLGDFKDTFRQGQTVPFAWEAWDNTSVATYLNGDAVADLWITAFNYDQYAYSQWLTSMLQESLFSLSFLHVDQRAYASHLYFRWRECFGIRNIHLDYQYQRLQSRKYSRICTEISA